ncbi:MAG: NAD(P)-binding protein [bacterium]|nr:NAD(P)-binding protein [bacterium]
MTDEKIKVAVLGGGVGAMTAATCLTSTPELRARYDVTVYQMGWRLGGKGASGRNAKHANRIEEHGLHVWMGWYQNAFSTIRDVYGEWDPPDGGRFSDWTDAFEPTDVITFMNRAPLSGEWEGWTVQFPPSPETPGTGGVMDSAWDYIVMTIEFLRHISPQTGSPFDEEPSKHEGFVERLLDDALNIFGVQRFPDEHGVHSSLTKAAEVAKRLPREHAKRKEHHHHGLIGLLEDVRDWVHRLENKSGELSVFFALVDMTLAIFRGLMSAGFPKMNEFSELWDDVDLRVWLKSHGAHKLSLESGVLRSFYELGFAYEDGDPKKPAVAAGSGLRAVLRMAGGYKGSVLWMMQAGMGDTIFSPVYQVLQRRGVKFEFFQRVDALRLDDSGRNVGAIDMTRQCKVKDGQPYDPVKMIEGVVSWPSEPYWDQIEDGHRLEELGVNFESYWSKDPAGESHTLVRGKDFDRIVFGISQASIPIVAAELVDKSERWKKACKRVQTVQTQAAQLWLSPTRRGLGWNGPPTILTSYVKPMATWADMTHLVDRESWPNDDRPGSIAYLCGVMRSPAEVPPPGRHDYPAQQYDLARGNARNWIESAAEPLWPRAVTNGEFDDKLFVTAPGVNPANRFDAQYFHANIDPSERYVLTVPGSTKHRLTSKDPEFDNIVLAGDWVLSCINGGCVEGAVVGGMQAARALCGVPEKIQGE